MPITFPRTIPVGIARAEFEPLFQTVQSIEGGGRLRVVEVGPARFEALVETATLDEVGLGVWRAFVASLRGGARHFLLGDPLRAYPIAHPAGFFGLTRAGGGAFDGAATGWSVSLARDVVTLSGLPVGLTLSEGDTIGWSWSGTRRALARCVEGAIANGSGDLSVQVAPAVGLYVSAGAVATLAEPRGVFGLVPGTASITLRPGRLGSVRFRARQHLEA